MAQNISTYPLRTYFITNQEQDMESIEVEEVYGKSEALSVLDDIRAIREAPLAVQIAARARFVEERLGMVEPDMEGTEHEQA